MSKRVKVTLKLESDTIIGSGYSIPGGEDIAVRKNSAGYPYISGETFKGLVRESLEDWLDWENPGHGMELAADFFGQRQEIGADESWHGNTCPKAVYITPLRMISPPDEADNCYSMRTFTSMEDGIAKEGSLRVASCVKKGQMFSGFLTCESENEQDLKNLSNALRCIRSIGTSRTRGFGEVCVTLGNWEMADAGCASAIPGNGNILCYRVKLTEPVRVTSRTDSHDTFLACQSHIPGSAIRGAVLNILSKSEPEWFENNKKYLLKQLCFGNILPDNGRENAAVIPTPKGFYADKLGGKFYHLLIRGDVEPNTKRAKLGSFAVLDIEKGEVDSWSPKTGENTRINLKLQKSTETNTGGMFQTGWLEEGQTASGMVILPVNAPADVKEKVGTVLSGEIRFGASVHSGLGLCEVMERKWVETPPEQTAYGYQNGDSIPNTLYLILLSPMALVNEFGEPCGISTELLSEKLGVKVIDLMCSTSVTERQGFNRTLGTRLPVSMMYDSGSTIRLTCETAPAPEAVRALEQNGLGIRREEGFGRVVFLKNLDKITSKTPSKQKPLKEMTEKQKKDRERVVWLGENPIPDGLSASQLGDLQTKCKVCKHFPDTAQNHLNDWFNDLIKRNDNNKPKFEPTQNFVERVLTAEDIPAVTIEERLDLLIDLIDYGRKGDD